MHRPPKRLCARLYDMNEFDQRHAGYHGSAAFFFFFFRNGGLRDRAQSSGGSTANFGPAIWSRGSGCIAIPLRRLDVCPHFSVDPALSGELTPDMRHELRLKNRPSRVVSILSFGYTYRRSCSIERWLSARYVNVEAVATRSAASWCFIFGMRHYIGQVGCSIDQRFLSFFSVFSCLVTDAGRRTRIHRLRRTSSPCWRPPCWCALTSGYH